MVMKNIYLYFGAVFLLSLFLVTVSHALPNISYFQPSSSDTAIITTGINSIDYFSSYPLASFYGIPVISLNSTLISPQVIANLTAQGIKNIILVGGPAVISNQTVQALQNAGFNVLRIFGITAPDTAISLADYFLPSANTSCAVIVPYNEDPSSYYSYQFAGSIYSARNRCILFPLYFNNIPLPVLSYLSSHNITNITFFGPKDLLPVVESQVSKSISVRYSNENESFVPPEKVSRYLIVGVNQNAWNASMIIGSLPSVNSSMALVSNVTAQMPGIVKYIKTENITDVKVVGIPSVVAQIDAYLKDNNITYESESVADAAFGLLKQFHKAFENESELHKTLINVAKELDSIKGQLSDILSKLNYYNLSIYNVSLNNSTALSLSKELDSLLSMAKNANMSISSNNISAALSMIAQINSQMNSDLYDSYMHRAIINNSFLNDRFNETEIQNEISDDINDQNENIGRFLSNLSINSTCKAQIAGILNSTSYELKKLAGEQSAAATSSNISAILAINNKIRSLMIQEGMLIRSCEIKEHPFPIHTENGSIIGGIVNGTIGNGSITSIIKIINSSNDNLPKIPGIES
ncbi:MAG: cell wall-binding repeat-containing protein [Candidatus Acidifodinimicrobium sp.]